MSTNEYYDSTGVPATNSPGRSSTIRSEFDLIEEGFKKLPPLSGKNNLPVFVNSGGSAMEALSVSSAVTALGLDTDTGTNSNGWYEQSPGGCVVCSHLISGPFNLQFVTVGTSLYFGTSVTWTFPFLDYGDSPNVIPVFVRGSSDTYGLWATVVSLSATSANIRVFSTSATASINADIYLTAIGKII